MVIVGRALTRVEFEALGVTRLPQPLDGVKMAQRCGYTFL
jgi:hypothetical protein